MKRLALTLVAVLSACGTPAVTADAGDQCQGAVKSPPNLLSNSNFECGLTGWRAVYGTLDLSTQGRTGSAAKLTVTAAGGRFAFSTPVVSDGAGKTYCMQAQVKGNAPVVRSVLIVDSGGGGTQQRFAEPLKPDEWKKTPPSSGLEAVVPPGSNLQVMFEVDTVAGSPTQAQVGAEVLVDDIDVWVSTDRCRETR